MKKYFLVSILTIISLFLSLTAIIVGTMNYNSGRSVFLDPPTTLVNQASLVANRTKPIHTFFADEADNLALYEPHGIHNNINEAHFFGNIDAYDGLENPETTLTAWQGDHVNSQLVVKNNLALEADQLEVSLANETGLASLGITVNYGFSEFVYASKNFNNPMHVLNPWGVHETLLVPEKLTENKTLPVMNPNKVNIMFIRITTSLDLLPSTTLEPSYELTFNFILNEQIVTWNTLHLVVRNYQLPTDDFVTSSVFIFSNYSRAANYWSSGKIPDFIKDPKDPLEFIQTIWPYIESDYRYNAQVLHNTSFISDIVPGRDPSDTNHYYWTTESVHISLLDWHRKADGTIYATDRSWEAFRWYLEQMYELGMRNYFLQGIQMLRHSESKTFWIYDEVEERYMQTPIGAGSLGLDNLEQVLDQLTIKRYQWEYEGLDLKDLNFYIYTDEQQSYLNGEISRWLDNFDPERQFYKFAATVIETDIDYNHLEDLENLDLLWVFLQDVYNEDYPKFMDLVNRRRALHKETGQYFLDGDATFNLTRAEPGINSYLLLALKKEGAGNYLKYSANAWNPEFIMWSSDYLERDEYWFPGMEMNYLSGDTIFSYAPKAPDEVFEKIEEPLPYMPANRLESLVQGRNLVKKVLYLETQGIITHQEATYLYENVDVRNKGSKTMSREKFNFNFTKTSLVKDLRAVSKTPSAFARWVRKKQFTFDEVTAYKVFKNFVSSY